MENISIVKLILPNRISSALIRGGIKTRSTFKYTN